MFGVSFSSPQAALSFLDNYLTTPEFAEYSAKVSDHRTFLRSHMSYLLKNIILTKNNAFLKRRLMPPFLYKGATSAFNTTISIWIFSEILLMVFLRRKTHDVFSDLSSNI